MVRVPARSLAGLVVLVVIAGCGFAGGDREQTVADAPVPSEVVGSATPDDPILEEGADEPEPEPTKTRERAKRPPPAERPPDAAPPGDDPGCPPKRKGAKVSRAKAKAALLAAAGRTYWPVSAPGITVPVKLVKAVAWQESGWQSNVYACDGGVGLMQVMPETAAHINQRFERSYDIDRYRDNAFLGANYLAWLTKYLGDAHFDGKYSLAARDCAGHADWCLLNLVISAYNFGYGAVDAAARRERLPNPQYVDNVRSLMRNCPCLSF